MSNCARGTSRFVEIWIKIFGKKANAIFWKSHSNLHFEIQSIIQEGHEILKILTFTEQFNLNFLYKKRIYPYIFPLSYAVKNLYIIY